MSGETILVADDDAAIRTVLNQALGRAGYEVRTTGNAATLWKWVSNGEGNLVITDVVMPGMNGADLSVRLAEQKPGLRVLFVSGYADDKQQVLSRLKRIEGQVRGLQRMVDDDTYCIDVLTQVAAVTKALQGVGLLLLDAVSQRDYPIITGVFLIWIAIAAAITGLAALALTRTLPPTVTSARALPLA